MQRFALKDIYLTDGDRRVVAAFKGQPVPAHYAHLVDDKDTTETPPSPEASAVAAADPTSDAEVSAEAEGDFAERLKKASDTDILLLAAVINGEAEERDLNKVEVDVPEDVVPGETPGWPIDPDTDEPYDLPESVREELAAGGSETVDYSKLKKHQLEEVIEKRHAALAEIEGTGSSGNVVTEDLIGALEAADAVRAAEE